MMNVDIKEDQIICVGHFIGIYVLLPMEPKEGSCIGSKVVVGSCVGENVLELSKSNITLLRC